MAKQTTIIIDLPIETPAMGIGDTYLSGNIDLDRVSDQFCAQVTLKNAVVAEFKISAELSVDGIDYVTAFQEDLTLAGGIAAVITDPEGYTSLFDFASGSGAGFLRLKVEVIAGSVDLTKVIMKAKESR
jgi:hypothetical protein